LRKDPSLLKLGFAGTPDFAVPALERLAAEHRICAVFTQPDRPSGRGQVLNMSPVKRRATELGLSIHQPATFKSPEVRELLRAAQLDALIVVAYGLILPAAVLELPKWGCINIHASLLPRWRGAAPIQRALLAGDQVTGVTIMRMEAGLDTGPMLAARSVNIGARDTATTLHDRLALLGAELIAETLRALEQGSVRETVQPKEGVTYAEKISKAEASITWADSAAQIARKVRAFNPWPIAETRCNGEQLRIWEAEPMDVPGIETDGIPPGTLLGRGRRSLGENISPLENIDVVCGRGVLRVLRLQLAGRKVVSAGDFLQGHRLGGMRFGAT
jgi:methionyl-tRNA formyltransferase